MPSPMKPTASSSNPSTSAFQRFLLLVLPPPQSKLDYWEDDESVSVTWVPSMLGRICGHRTIVRLYRKIQGGGWVDVEAGLPANRWLAAEIDEHVVKEKMSKLVSDNLASSDLSTSRSDR